MLRSYRVETSGPAQKLLLVTLEQTTGTHSGSEVPCDEFVTDGGLLRAIQRDGGRLEAGYFCSYPCHSVMSVISCSSLIDGFRRLIRLLEVVRHGRCLCSHVVECW